METFNTEFEVVYDEDEEETWHFPLLKDLRNVMGKITPQQEASCSANKRSRTGCTVPCQPTVCGTDLAPVGHPTVCGTEEVHVIEGDKRTNNRQSSCFNAARMEIQRQIDFRG
ncbi:hypothetical protein CAPTEDRAFT_210037 [Capitella teleta]|uniref:Uncharacterized protein n=1 Tax=Capitella teleta TaxID=283909 RepID=R7TLT5_CAPTE|nr:hypothetical protein CAPTEDRAFT_210037 [Capitella teleta]|eukprot:ELT94477.1 hypothetical protein CAPTEDRAFT_210037 [Capitella teleta]